MWLACLCPLCKQTVTELGDRPGNEARARCRNRHCRDKPRVSWQVTELHTVVVLTMDVDRRAPAVVGSGRTRCMQNVIASSKGRATGAGVGSLS